MERTRLMTRRTSHTETRALVRLHGLDARKRGTVVDGLIALTDDGLVVHVPTGLTIEREGVVQKKEFILHMLDADPAGWELTRSWPQGSVPSREIRDRIRKTRDSYREVG